MFCQIDVQPEKRKPYPSRVYANPRWEPLYPGSEKLTLKGDEILREPKQKFRISLCNSRRGDGKMCKHKRHIVTVSYWDIVSDYQNHLRYRYRSTWKWDFRMVSHGFCDCWVNDRLLKKYPNPFEGEIERYVKLIDDKLEPIAVRVVEEYKESDECKWLLVNIEMENEQREKEEALKREADQKAKEYQERCHQQQRKQYQEFFDWRKRPASLDLNGDVEMAKQLIHQGYRQLATKLHPDKGGDTKDMQVLNAIKDKLLQAITA